MVWYRHTAKGKSHDSVVTGTVDESDHDAKE
jgi:hypothetical protein